MKTELSPFPSPLWGGVRGGGPEVDAPLLPHAPPPLPTPPPQGGREHTEFGEGAHRVCGEGAHRVDGTHIGYNPTAARRHRVTHEGQSACTPRPSRAAATSSPTSRRCW